MTISGALASSALLAAVTMACTTTPPASPEGTATSASAAGGPSPSAAAEPPAASASASPSANAASCAPPAPPTEPAAPVEVTVGKGAVLLTVLLDRQMTATTWNDPVMVADGAHVTLSLRPATQVADGPAPEPVMKESFPFERLPIRVTLKGTLPATVKKGGVELSATVFNHAGDDLVVGDLTSETRTPAPAGGGAEVGLFVSGVEACDHPCAGGFCSSKR